MAERVTCDLCERELDVHSSYVVRMDVFADPSIPPMTSEEIAAVDLDQAVQELSDQTEEWPARDWEDLCAIGASRWVLPRDFGGEELSALELHLNYERIASASPAAALILTQRDAAIDLIAGSPRELTAGGPLASLL